MCDWEVKATSTIKRRKRQTKRRRTKHASYIDMMCDKFQFNSLQNKIEWLKLSEMRDIVVCLCVLFATKWNVSCTPQIIYISMPGFCGWLSRRLSCCTIVRAIFVYFCNENKIVLQPKRWQNGHKSIRRHSKNIKQIKVGIYVVALYLLINAIQCRNCLIAPREFLCGRFYLITRNQTRATAIIEILIPVRMIRIASVKWSK